MKTNQPFLGREAIEKTSQLPLTKMLAGFTTEREDIVLSGRETILRNGVFAGYITAVAMAIRRQNQLVLAMCEMPMASTKPIS